MHRMIGVRGRRLAILAMLFFCHAVTANPNGPQVVHGQANFSQPDVNTLNITNSPAPSSTGSSSPSVRVKSPAFCRSLHRARC
jgi:hypothetical protein